MELVDAIILGVVQGITEFLPVSSTGHLVLAHELLSIEGVNQLAFDAILHFATTAAVVVYFWSDIWNLIQVALRKLGRLPVNERDVTLLYALVVATIPAVVVGLLLESTIDSYFRDPIYVAVTLFLASVFFMYAEWRYYLNPVTETLTVKRGLLVGLFQALALLPGMSRSGATIAGGMLLGLTRYDATRFSFLLAIPITLGVGSKMMIDLLAEGTAAVAWGVIAVGAGVAFIVAIIFIHFFLKFIRKYTLWPFVWYGITLSALVGYVSMFTI